MMNPDLQSKIERALPQIQSIFKELSQVIIGQRQLLERLFLAILADGHVLVEGVPGLAKTTAVRSVAQILKASFQRIQFTPDLLPSDLLGTQVYNPKTQEFSIKKGPLFHHIILADEINRAPAKVQSALLEAMQERQITLGEETFPLPQPFHVLATQNPIEQEGTYPLPEAQLDRFMFKLKVDYPSREEEREIMERQVAPKQSSIQPLLHPEMIFEYRSWLHQIYVDPKVSEYIVRLVFATREPKTLKLENLIQFGASPRASINLNLAARGVALCAGRAYVLPQDVKDVFMDVMRHRVLLTFEAEAEGTMVETVLQKILDHVEVP